MIPNSGLNALEAEQVSVDNLSPMYNRPATPGALCLVVVVMCGLLYGGFLWNPPFFDDSIFFDGMSPLRYAHHWTFWQLRWLPYATYGWTQMALGRNLAWCHLGNLMLHSANSVLLLLLLNRLLALVLPDIGRLQILFSAFFGALLFALHPIAVYAVGYLNQRSTLMAMLFFLLMLHMLIHAVSSGKHRHYWGVAGCYLLSVFMKEHIVMAPAVALVLALLIRKSLALDIRKAALPALAAFCIMVLVTLQVKAHGVIGQAYQNDGQRLLALTLSPDSQQNPFFLSIMTQASLFFKYWGLWLLPHPGWMSVDMFEPFARHYLDAPFMLGLAAFVLYGVLAIWLLLKRGKLGLLGFVLLTPWLLFATELSTVRIQEPFVLYRSYLWMALPIGCLPVLLTSLPIGRSSIYLTALCLLLLPLSVNRLQSFSHPVLLWDDAVRLAESQPLRPGMERLYYNRALSLASINQYAMAIKDYTAAIRINPKFSYAYMNRGVAFHQLGQEARALEDFDAMVKMKPDDPRGWLDRGLTLRLLGKPLEAEKSVAEACRIGFQLACKQVAIGKG